MSNKDDGKQSLLKRDEHNRLDKDDAARVTEKLVKKLLTEERAYQKDISFMAKSNKRDIMIFVTIGIRNSIDGHICLQDTEEQGFERWSERDPYKYKVFDYIEADIQARHIPCGKEDLGKILLGIFNTAVNYIARMGGIRG